MATLSKGARGSAVIELQQLLTQAGFSPGAIDGIFGSNTETAVKSFQNGLGYSPGSGWGVVDAQTLSALQTAASRAGRPPPPPSTGIPAGSIVGTGGGPLVLPGTKTTFGIPNTYLIYAGIGGLVLAGFLAMQGNSK